MAGNPNHPVVREMEQQWHKLLAILMWKLKEPMMEVTITDLAEMPDDMAVLVDTRNGRFFLRLVTNEEGERISREAGGLPV